MTTGVYKTIKPHVTDCPRSFQLSKKGIFERKVMKRVDAVENNANVNINDSWYKSIQTMNF